MLNKFIKNIFVSLVVCVVTFGLFEFNKAIIYENMSNTILSADTKEVETILSNIKQPEREYLLIEYTGKRNNYFLSNGNYLFYGNHNTAPPRVITSDMACAIFSLVNNKNIPNQIKQDLVDRAEILLGYSYIYSKLIGSN